jgi:hypothetical protein
MIIGGGVTGLAVDVDEVVETGEAGGESSSSFEGRGGGRSATVGMVSAICPTLRSIRSS